MRKFINVSVAMLTLAMTACTLGYQPTTQSYPPSSPQPQSYPQQTNYPPTQQTSYPSPQPSVSTSQQGEISLQIFYDQLSPYGTWVSYQNYGYVWMPNAGPDFQPYASSGHWVFTDMGWTWYSTYSWGWAPFHYGRWFYDNYYGWMWLPDTEWGPAWVTWRSGGDYYGWAPMEPGININIVFGGTYQVPDNRWVFVRNHDIDRHNVRNYTINQTNNTTIINNTTVIHNTGSNRQRNVTYMTGPNRDDVQRKKGRPVNQVVVQEHNRPGQNVNNREMKIYKPDVQQDRSDRRKSAPLNIENINNVKPVSEKYKGNSQRGQQRNSNQIQRNNQKREKPNKQAKKDKDN